MAGIRSHFAVLLIKPIPLHKRFSARTGYRGREL